MKRPIYQTAGFAMLEVLIAILVLSFGLLGMAGLQATGLRNNHSAYMRAIATQQAGDIADRMRANLWGVSAGNYNMTSTAIPSDQNCTGAACTSAQMAQHDIFDWKTNLASLLPGGVGIACLDSTPTTPAPTPAAPGCDGFGSSYAIKIWWNDEKDPAATPNLKLFVTSF